MGALRCPPTIQEQGSTVGA